MKTPLESFRTRYRLSETANLKTVAVAVESVCEANFIAYEFLGSIDNQTNREGFVLRTHLNILGRLFEQTQGMLLCIAGESYTSSESIARVVVEGSINLMYMASKGNESAIVSFLDAWLIEHGRKLEEWKSHMKGSAHESRVVPMITSRQELISSYKLLLDHIVSTCGIERNTHKGAWPKSLFKRFEALGRETDYYESYHRLSGSAHINGEDTFIWLLSSSMADNQKQALAKEAAAFSIMMSRIASIIFIDSAIACCMSHGMKSEEQFSSLRSKLESSVEEIARDAGVPQ